MQMLLTNYLNDIKDDPYGIIALGAVGSLLATFIALLMKKVADSNVKATKAEHWDFGWMSSFCEASIKNQPIFMIFLASTVCKILILCTCTICSLIVISILISNAFNTFVYVFCVLILSLGILSFMRAYSTYRLIRVGHRLWMGQRDRDAKEKSLLKGRNDKGAS